MALSNIFREPRREITESAVGIAAFALLVYGDYEFASWFHEVTKPVGACPIPIGMILGVIAALLGIGALFLTHAIGEGVCNSLARRGVELRPKRRLY